MFHCFGPFLSVTMGCVPRSPGEGVPFLSGPGAGGCGSDRCLLHGGGGREGASDKGHWLPQPFGAGARFCGERTPFLLFLLPRFARLLPSSLFSLFSLLYPPRAEDTLVFLGGKSPECSLVVSGHGGTRAQCRAWRGRREV